jgi:hypothetical protein
MDCIEPVEAAFVNRFTRLEEQDPSNFLKLQEIVPFNSSVGAPLSQRLLVESGGALAWWMSLVKEVKDFTETMKINRKHKGRQARAHCYPLCKSHLNSSRAHMKNAGFKMMVAAAKKLKLKFEDVYLPGADSPDGTWKGIIEAHSYEFVFLCFMNAFAKQVLTQIRTYFDGHPLFI